jgi:hypothetical protein
MGFGLPIQEARPDPVFALKGQRGFGISSGQAKAVNDDLALAWLRRSRGRGERSAVL